MATAQLKLLLSFKPIPVPGLHNTADMPVASDTSYHSSRSSGGSQELSSGRDEDSATTQIKPQVAQEMPDSRGSSLSRPRRVSQLPSPRQHKQDHRGPHKQQQQQQHVPHSPEHVVPLAAKPTALLDSAPSQSPADPPEAAMMAVGDEALSSTEAAAEGRGQEKSALASSTTGDGRAPGLSPDVALSRLIQRAEQLRQMISGASAEGCSSSLISATTGTKDVPHCSTSAAGPPSTHAAEPEGVRADKSLSAALSANSSAQNIQHSIPSAANGHAIRESRPGDPTAEQTPSSVSVGTAPTTGKAKRVSERAWPVSKVRRVAEPRPGVLGRGKTPSPQRVTSLQPQVRPPTRLLSRPAYLHICDTNFGAMKNFGRAECLGSGTGRYLDVQKGAISVLKWPSHLIDCCRAL